MRSIPITLAALLLATVTMTLPAQTTGWGIAPELGMASFGGHSNSIGTEPEASGHPARASSLGLRLDHTSRKIRFSLGLLYTSTGFEIENDDASVEAKGVLNLYTIMPEVGFLLIQSRESQVRIHAGGVMDYWSPDDDNARTRIGGIGGASVELPFSGRISAQIRWDITFTGSVFEEGDLPPEFERKTGRRQRWVLGARYQL